MPTEAEMQVNRSWMGQRSTRVCHGQDHDRPDHDRPDHHKTFRRLSRRSRYLALLIVIILGIGWGIPAIAQTELTRAQVYKVNNTVDLNHQNQGNWMPAHVGDTLVPQDAIRTAVQSRAELLFNEGTLVRTGEGTTFRFPPGRRSMELVDGSALIMIRPGQGDSRVQTPQAVIVAHGTALFVQHDPQQNASTVGVLTNSPAGPVSVSDLNGQQTIELTAGQFVSVANGVMGLVETFVLPLFYESVDLASGLGNASAGAIAQEAPEVQQTINAVRAEAIDPLRQQIAWLQGFCSQNAGTVQGLLQNSPILQLLFPASIPPINLTISTPESDLVVTPIRSIAGLVWLGNYCQSRPQ